MTPEEWLREQIDTAKRDRESRVRRINQQSRWMKIAIAVVAVAALVAPLVISFLFRH